MSLYEGLIKTYDQHIEDYGEYSRIAPIAHKRMTAELFVILDSFSNIKAIAKGRKTVLIPCTAESENRTSGIAPHLVHDTLEYVGFDGKKHDVYMERLEEYYLTSPENQLYRIVLDYLKKGTLLDDLSRLVDVEEYKKNVVYFVVEQALREHPRFIADFEWSKHYLSTLPKNGICGITGKEDYIPSSYPSNLRYLGDKGKLFIANNNNVLNTMPDLIPGYIASQKICHALQFLCSEWVEDEEVEYIPFAKTDAFAGLEKKKSWIDQL